VSPFKKAAMIANQSSKQIIASISRRTPKLEFLITTTLRFSGNIPDSLFINAESSINALLQ
jgi:hypothetical protein